MPTTYMPPAGIRQSTWTGTVESVAQRVRARVTHEGAPLDITTVRTTIRGAGMTDVAGVPLRLGTFVDLTSDVCDALGVPGPFSTWGA